MKRRGRAQRTHPSPNAPRANSIQPEAPTTPRNRAVWQSSTMLAGGLLVLMAMVTFAPVVANQYIWDDDAYVTQNLTLRSLPGLWSIWFKPLTLPQYYPLVHTTYWVEYHLWGLVPLGYHVVNVLLHATSAILVWRLLARLHVPGAWLAAAIFAVHPVTVESVAWITERKNVLSLPLALASMLCYLRFAPADASPADSTVQSSRRSYYAFAMLLFVAALLCKTIVASMPAVLLVIYWWKRGRISWSDVAPLAPLFVVGAVMGVCTALLERYHVGAIGEEWEFSLADRILIAGRAAWFYAGKLVWPHPIIFFYPRWEIDDHAWWQYLYLAAALALLVGLWFARRRIGRGPLAAALIFGGVLTPVLGFLNVYPFRFSFVADHFQYHASLGLIALFGAGLALAARRISAPLENSLSVAMEGTPVSRNARKVATRVLAGVGLVTLAILSFRQTSVYYDVRTLYADVIKKNPSAWMAYSNLGAQLVRDGQVEEALDMFRETLRINPKHYRVHTLYAGALFNLGVRKGFEAGQLEEAIEHFEEALRLKPTWTEAREGLAQAFFRQRRFAEAQAQLNLVLEQQPLSPTGLLVMGSLMVEAKKWPEAQTYFERAVQMKPDLVEGYQGIGLSLINQGKPREAISPLEVVIQIDPESFEAHYTLGNVLLELKDFRAAIEQYLIAIQIKPDSLDALSNLGAAYGIMSNADSAIDCFEQVLRIDPNFQGAASNLQRAQSLKQNQSKHPPDAK